MSFGIFLLIVVMISSFTLGFIIGKVSERIAWNELIREGKIPMPSKR